MTSQPFAGFLDCPLCRNPRGYKVLRDFRYWFVCHQCGLETPLVMLAQWSMKAGSRYFPPQKEQTTNKH